MAKFFAVKYEDGDCGIVPATENDGWFELRIAVGPKPVMLKPVSSQSAAHSAIAKLMRFEEKEAGNDANG